MCLSFVWETGCLIIINFNSCFKILKLFIFSENNNNNNNNTNTRVLAKLFKWQKASEEWSRQFSFDWVCLLTGARAKWWIRDFYCTYSFPPLQLPNRMLSVSLFGQIFLFVFHFFFFLFPYEKPAVRHPYQYWQQGRWWWERGTDRQTDRQRSIDNTKTST